MPRLRRVWPGGRATGQGDSNQGDISQNPSIVDPNPRGRRPWRATAFAVLYLAVVAAALAPPVAPLRWASGLTGERLSFADLGAGEGRAGDTRWADAFPLDLTGVVPVAERKERFVAALLPVVAGENRSIAAQRDWLMDHRRRFVQGTAKAADRQRLAALVREYRLARRFTVPATGPVAARLFAELLLRVDSLPPSLVLAQAAIESGWGTSRFVREGNNLFGQWVTGDTPGLVPAAATLAEYRIATYDSLGHSVRSYLRNVNTHRAYRQLRRWRADLRAAGVPLDSTILSAGLVRYSQRGEAYVEELLAIIRGNRLDRHDTPEVQLASERAWWGFSARR